MARPTPFVPLPGSHRAEHDAAAPLADRGERVEISVRVRRRPGVPFPLAGRLGAAPARGKRHVDREAFAEMYGASTDDLRAVTAYAEAAGLEVVSASHARRTVVLAGSLGALTAAFPAEVRAIEIDGERCRKRVGDVHVPRALAGIVEAVLGFSNHRRARPNIKLPACSGRPADSCTPLEVAALYNFPEGYDGRGQTIGLIELGGGYREADLDRYFGGLGVPRPEVVSVAVGGRGNCPGVDRADGEVALDIQIAGAIAPGARIAVYFADWSERGWVDALSAAVHDEVNRPSVISVCWGWAERERAGSFAWSEAAMAAVNAVLEEAAILGITVLVAAGDDGANDGVRDGRMHVDFPASSPWVLGCGGTSAEIEGGCILREVVWNDGPRGRSGGGTTGGGVSDVFTRPEWQSAVTAATGRGVPDIAGIAGGRVGYSIHLAGRDVHGVVGTSAVAPLYAGLFARINQALGKPVGYVNPLVYRNLAARGVFRDITEGHNDAGGGSGEHAAARGWDPCTGWGSIDGTRLLEALGGAPAKPRPAPEPSGERSSYIHDLAPRGDALDEAG